jgi:hypothetical protein
MLYLVEEAEKAIDNTPGQPLISSSIRGYTIILESGVFVPKWWNMVDTPS